jgi:lysophospholipase L1-like esterase
MHRAVLGILVMFFFVITTCLPAHSEPLVDGSFVHATFTTTQQTHEFTFQASAGHTIFLTTSGGLWHSYQLLNPSGAVVDSDSQATSFKYIRHTAAAGGVYRLRVFPFYVGALGAFSVFYVRAPGASALGALPDSAVSGMMGGGRIDSYELQVVQGVKIQLGLGSNSGFTRLHLVDPMGGLVAQSTTGVEYTALSTGRYTVVVSSTTITPAAYSLHNVLIPGSNENGLLSGTGVSADSITPADIDSFTFRGVQGASVTFVASGSVGLYLYLYAPSGALVSWTYPFWGQTLHIPSLPTTGLFTFVVRAGSSVASGNYQINHTVPVTSISYAALGDSYSSGEGVFPFVGSSVGVFNGCNRSALAYSQQVRLPYEFLPISWDPNSLLDFIACTGATTENVRSSGESRFGEPPQLVASQAVPRDLITITVGGNDAHFAPILGLCLAVDDCPDYAPFPGLPFLTLRNAFPYIVSLVRDKLVSTLTELRNSAPQATVLALDYPIVAGGNECPFSQGPGSSNLKLSASEQVWMREVNVLVNQAVASAAQIAGVHYVSVQDHFKDHGVCGDKEDWIFGTWHIWPKGLFHPNWRGQFEYARVVNKYLGATRILWPHGYNAAGLPRNPPPIPSSGPFLGISVPAGVLLPTFREDLDVQLVASTPACQTSHATKLVPNGSVQIGGDGFASNSPVIIDLLVGQQTIAVGQVLSNAAGMLAVTLPLPQTLPEAEIAYLRASGVGTQGELRILTRRVRTGSTLGADGDVDGIPASCDNCPLVSNVNQSDQDMDGHGDACDSCQFDPFNDEDGDGVCAPADLCPQDPLNDSDLDGICDSADNCPHIFNSDQKDVNGDGIGDACVLSQCLPLEIVVRGGRFGELSVTPGGCPDGRYFDGQVVRMYASPHRKGAFAGWGGTYQTTQRELIFTMSPGTAITAAFLAR